MTDHERAQQEAMLEPYSFLALEWADEEIARTGRWPTRRFRIEVEQPDGGCLRSRLLEYREAVLHPNFVGLRSRMVEVIPPPPRRK